uniref:Putative secreted peptide n=1 Tax=Rhipicephalus pulchellus TaxID=72859 RepID=L7M8R3_RHIPC
MVIIKMNAAVFSILPIVLLTVPATSNRCPRSTCTYNQPQWCPVRPNPCHCPCISGGPPRPLSPCNNGPPTVSEVEEEERLYPDMARCPKHSCHCGETLTCLKKKTSCACTCVKPPKGCSYPWDIACITRCTNIGPRCVCVCVAPLPEPEPRLPCCRGNRQISSQGSYLPCCNRTQTVAHPAPRLPCCEQNYGRR